VNKEQQLFPKGLKGGKIKLGRGTKKQGNETLIFEKYSWKRSLGVGEKKKREKHKEMNLRPRPIGSDRKKRRKGGS